jgi:DNA polymerase-3 subunit beta
MIQTDTVVATDLRLSCPKGELVRKLGVVSRALSTRSAVQILSGVLMQVRPEQVVLAATDMELSLRCTLEADVEGEGDVVVPGRLLVDLARLLPEDEVVIEHRAEENVVHLACGAARYQLHTYNAEDFPRLPEVGGGEAFQLDAATVLETVERVSRCASRDESRPVLTGILVRFEGPKLVMAATDSYRLAVKETPVSDTVPELEAIIPARALTELGRIAQGAEHISLGLRENQVLFGLDDTWMTTRRIDGQFPNYRQLLPETFEHEVTLPREELLEVVRRVAVMAQRNSPLRLRFGEGEVAVSAQTADVGEARESLPAGFSGEPLEIGFNADFLREGIESVPDDELRLKLISPLRPGLIEAADDFWYLIMPIRLAS